MPAELFHRNCNSFRSCVEVTTRINSDAELGFIAETNDPCRSLMGGHFRLLYPSPETNSNRFVQNAFFSKVNKTALIGNFELASQIL
ncbi:hypothetical protein CEXT_442991 [Caerostris extrusa]|uniref:Uncharacterized protein n=1 Tax=Caerostris extrusa TaxID=172846 RepID=A0AAV4NQ02_CAEEX|nr:hypothetical protein CEXT_442991 [Caerostris extrusa]